MYTFRRKPPSSVHIWLKLSVKQSIMGSNNNENISPIKNIQLKCITHSIFLACWSTSVLVSCVVWSKSSFVFFFNVFVFWESVNKIRSNFSLLVCHSLFHSNLVVYTTNMGIWEAIHMNRFPYSSLFTFRFSRQYFCVFVVKFIIFRLFMVVEISCCIFGALVVVESVM